MAKKATRPHLKEVETDWDRFWKTFWKGSKPKEKSEDIIAGHLNSEIKTEIIKRINTIINSSESIKIGKTGDSYIRADKSDYRGAYKHIHILYRSTSKEYVSLAEEYCITKYMTSHPKKVDNKTNKRNGKLTSYDGYYYLYVVSR